MKSFNKKTLVSMVLIITLLMVFCFTGCNNKTDKINSFDGITFKVKDLDGSEIINDKTNSIFESFLISDYNATFITIDGKKYIKSIKNSIKDDNYVFSILVNDKETSLEDLNVKIGDTVELVSKCLKDFDKYDLIVDKVIYNYAKNYLPKEYKLRSTCYDYKYWFDMAISLMQRNGYDKSIFKTNPSSALLNVLNNAKSAIGSDWGKLLYSVRANNLNLSKFKPEYQKFINNIGSKANAYSTPFEISMTKFMGVNSKNLETLINNTKLNYQTPYGPDSSVWLNCCLNLFNDYELKDLKYFINEENFTSDWNKIPTEALIISLFASFNYNIRNLQENDFIEDIINRTYNEKTNLLDIEEFSKCQVYAYLMSYKVQRDLGVEANLYE